MTISREAVLARTYEPALVHWAGGKSTDFHGDPRADLWEIFDRQFHDQVPLGDLKRRYRSAIRSGRVRRTQIRYGIEGLARDAAQALGLLPLARRIKRRLFPVSGGAK